MRSVYEYCTCPIRYSASATRPTNGSALTLLNFNEDPTPENGFIRLSHGSYSEWSEESDWASTVEIPELLESVQSLRFMGMKKRVCQQIYSNWVGAIRDFPNMPVDFFNFIEATIMGAPTDAMTLADDWDAALKDIGMNKATREAILDPRFINMRLTRSAKEWALDTADMGWQFLVNLDETVKKNKNKIIRHYLPNGAATRAGRRSLTRSKASFLLASGSSCGGEGTRADA
jgi:hypothetical protein